MKAQCISGTSTIETYQEDGGRDNEQEGNRSKNSMCFDERVIASHGEEAIGHPCLSVSSIRFAAVFQEVHTIILHGSKVQAH